MALGNIVVMKSGMVRHEARLWAEKNPDATTDEIIAEAESRYYTFFERKNFAQEAEFIIGFTRKSNDTAE